MTPVLTHVVFSVSGVRGAATIARGTLTEQKVENVAATGAASGVAIRVNADGYLALALVAVRSGRDECRGYVLTGREDALFLISRYPASECIDLATTEGAAEWSRAWRMAPDGAPDYLAIEPARAIAQADFRQLEKLAQDFVAQWIWFSNGPREEIAIEAERYERLGYAINDANLRSAALHRIASGAGGATHYATLPPDFAWIEEAIARCWPGKSGG